jgi:thioredoxin 1
MQTSQIRDVDTAAFEAEVLRAAGPVLVEFSADWCPPCHMIEPVVAGLATALAGRLTVRRVDVDRDQEVSIRYGVLGMPTLILFAGGEPVDRLVGFSGAGHVRRWVADALDSATGVQRH